MNFDPRNWLISSIEVNRSSDIYFDYRYKLDNLLIYIGKLRIYQGGREDTFCYKVTGIMVIVELCL